MISILDMWSDIGNAIVEAIRVLFSQIAFIIYDFIGVVYNLFIYISRAQILDNSLVMSIYEKVGMILGLFMVFKLMFSLLQSLIDPSKFNDKKSGFSQVIIRLVLAIVLLGITPTIFKEAYNIQNLLVGSNDGGNNVFYKLIVGSNVNGDATSFGKTLSTELYFSFFTDEEDPHMTKTSDQEGTVDTSDMTPIEALKNRILTEGKSFAITKEALAERGPDNQTHVVEFNFLFVVIVGAVVLWILFMYCFQVAVRVFQLAYLQLIAPIPIFSYISDPDGVFKKWVSQCVATYIDLFIRLCIIYFIVFLSTHVLEQLNNADSILVSSLGGIDPTMLFFVKVVLLVGLLFFAKKVPDLLKDLFPKLGGAGKFSFGLNPKKELFDPIAKSAPGKAIGWMGKKAISGIDRKIHHLPKPRNKAQQWLDKVAPGHAEVVKNRNEIKDRHKLYDEGMGVYKTFNGEILDANNNLKSGVFNSSKFAQSYQKVANAKKDFKDAERVLEYWRNEVAQGNIDTNDSRYQQAVKNQKTYSSKLEAVKRDHDNNRKIYVRDARIEDAFNYYKDMNGNAPVVRVSEEEVAAEIQRRQVQNNNTQRNIEISQQHFDNLHGINYNASDHGAPTENYSAIAEKYSSNNVETINAEKSQQYFDDLNGINYKASDHGAPTENYSAIVEKYNEVDEQVNLEARKRTEQANQMKENAKQSQQHFDKLNGVIQEDGNGPKINSENSIFVKLDQDAKKEQEVKKQKQMQKEFKNRKNDE